MAKKTNKKKTSGFGLQGFYVLVLAVICISLGAHAFHLHGNDGQQASSPAKNDAPDASLVTAETLGSGVLEAEEAEDEVITGAREVPPVYNDAAQRLPGQVSITISATGDCTLAKAASASYGGSLPEVYDKNGAGYFFTSVKDIFAADDMTLVNLEGALTTAGSGKGKEFVFKSDPEYVQILKEGNVEVATLANNHSHDYGDTGYQDTIDTLDQAGIVNFGYDRTTVYETSQGVRIGLCGYCFINQESNQDDVIQGIDYLKGQNVDLIIAYLHFGVEKDTVPTEDQKKWAHAAVDAGADLVLGAHSHRIQGIEEYNGKNICYSLSNFCFGGNKKPSDMDSFIFQQTFTFNDGKKAIDNVTNIIPITISSQSGKNDYQPTPATGSEAERILAKINERSAAIGGGAEN